MSSKQIFSKTMPFVWAKLVLGLATVLISVVIFGVLYLIGSLFGDGGKSIAIWLWLGATGIVRFAIMHYMGYLVKAGHVAVIATAVTTGKVPDNQVEYGKAMVTERFVESNVYFAVDKLVGGAVKQIGRMLDKVGNALDFVPGMDAVMKVGKMFVEISLGYIDECCLGYSFVNRDKGPFRSAADGVVIYAQNWKALLKNAAKTTAVVIISFILFTLAALIIFGGLFKLLKLSSLVAFLLAVFTAWAFKTAFIDSWVLVEMMTTYMQLVPNTVITFDLYGKLSGFSSSFKELYQKGQNEPQPAMAGAPAGYAAPTAAAAPVAAAPAAAAPVAAAPAAAAPVAAAPVAAAPAAAAPVAAAPVAASIFCGQCGAKNAPGTAFCGSCGSKL